jgi:hypothetical protein
MFWFCMQGDGLGQEDMGGWGDGSFFFLLQMRIFGLSAGIEVWIDFLRLESY